MVVGEEKRCKLCGGILSADRERSEVIFQGVCKACIAAMSAGSTDWREVIESINAPILLLQPTPRLVYTANKKALAIFGKNLSQTEGHRGGEVFGCLHAFSALGCGKDENCTDCKIKNAIVETFITGKSCKDISAVLNIKKTDGTNKYLLKISTESMGNFALVKIEQFRQL